MDPRLIFVIEFIDANLSNKITSSEAARRINLSHSYLCEIFRREMGVKFSVYVTKAKMERAQVLLKSSFLSIKEISYAVGFNQESNFDRSFKKYAGLSPSAYRKQFAGKGI